MFNGFSAWFAPELHSYKQTWTRHGGEEKEIADADIAFVTDKTASGEASLKPTMKILRPDWIEDSIRGRRRLSLKRYKSVFPGLERFDSENHGHMAIGMDAFNSTNIISLEKSWQLHQPEQELCDLSITPSNDNNATHDRDSIINNGNIHATAKKVTATQLSLPLRNSQVATLSKSFTEKTYEKEINGIMEPKKSQPIRSQQQQSNRPSLEIHSGSREQHHLPNIHDGELIIDPTSYEIESDLSEVTSELPPPKKKRRLPKSLMRSKRPPARTHNSQDLEEFFASSSDDDVAISHSNGQEKMDPILDLWREETVPLPTRQSLSPVPMYSYENKIESTNRDSTQGYREKQSKKRQIRAEDYLIERKLQLDKQTRFLLQSSPPGVRLINIDHDNIKLQKK